MWRSSDTQAIRLSVVMLLVVRVTCVNGQANALQLPALRVLIFECLGVVFYLRKCNLLDLKQSINQCNLLINVLLNRPNLLTVSLLS